MFDCFNYLLIKGNFYMPVCINRLSYNFLYTRKGIVRLKFCFLETIFFFDSAYLRTYSFFPAKKNLIFKLNICSYSVLKNVSHDRLFSDIIIDM